MDGYTVPNEGEETVDECTPLCVHPFKFPKPARPAPANRPASKHRHESQLHDVVDSLEDRRNEMQLRMQETRTRMAATMKRLQDSQFGRDERMMQTQDRLNQRNIQAVGALFGMMNRWP